MAHEIKILLNPLRTLKDGRKSLVLRLTVNRKRNYYSLGFKAFPDEFNEKEMKFYKKWNPIEFKDVNARLMSEYKRALNIITTIEKEGETLSIDLFSKNYLKNNCKTNVITYFKQIIDAETKKGKIGNANVYTQAMNAIQRFNGNRTLEFSDVTVSYLNRLELFLHKTCSGNGISNYMRTFRALLNKAIAEDYLKKDKYPFKNQHNPYGYNISKLETKTIKRALSEKDIEKLVAFKPEKHAESVAKCIFLFSFYNMGMNFVDIAYLKWSDIYDDRIHYRRKKTGKDFTIKILPPIKEILSIFSSFQNELDFVFPVFNEIHKTEVQKKTRLKTALKKINKDLRSIGESIDLASDFTFSTYVARHSWATILKRKGVSTSLISEGLGHSNEDVTQIYLDSFESEAMDEMNEMLLS